MTPTELIGQGLGFIAMALIILSFQFKKRAMFYTMQISGNLFFAASFLLLGNMAGSLMNLMGVFRGFIMLINLLFVGGAAYAGTAGGMGWACLVSFAAQTLGTFSLWYGSDKAIRWVQLCGISPLWITNNVVLTSPPAIGGTICEVFSMISTIVYLVRVRKDIAKSDR